MPSIRFWVLFEQIKRMEAADDLRALVVAGFGANPGKDGAQFSKFSRDLQAIIAGTGAAETDNMVPSMPTSALHGPFVKQVESGVLTGRLAEMERQVEEQKEAWRQGGWQALQVVLNEQRIINRNSR